MNNLKHILLVEDDPQDIKLIQSAFSKHNLANGMAIARDGVEALDYLYRRGAFALRRRGDPVVILLDLKMPRLDGIEVLHALKSDENMCRIPIVILTSSCESRDLDECYKLGVNAYVVKPVQFAEFVEVAMRIGVFWALVNEPPPYSGEKK